MDFLNSIFGVFSRRQSDGARHLRPVGDTFRSRVVLLIRDVIRSDRGASDFWKEVHQKFQYLHGTTLLSPDKRPSNEVEDVLQYLETCDSTHFLDFVEYIFQVNAAKYIVSKAQFVDGINSFFEVDDLPYFLTDYIETEEAGVFRGAPASFVKVSAYPQVILKESRLAHSEAIKPTLKLLIEPAFSSANHEFLEALEEYRKRDFGDCLTKCGSAFESVMKVICEKRKWQYDQKDTAGRLIRTIISRSDLEPFFKDALLIVGTIRNRLSNAHGAGVAKKQVQKHIAHYTINSTAAAILLLVEETL